MRLGKRLGDDPHDTLKYALTKAKGCAVEFGVGKGHSLRLIAEHMPVTGFDSFQGLPQDWRPGFGKGRFKCAPPDVPNATLVVGLFEDTVPGYDWPPDIGLIHLDADLYVSTKTVLEHVPLRRGTYVVFDEFHGYPGFEEHEYRAWNEKTDLEYATVGHGPEQACFRIK